MTQSLIQFKPNSPINLQIFTHPTEYWLKNLLQDTDWDVGHGRYQILHNLHIFKHAQVLNLKQLKVRWVMNQSMLREIGGVEFPYLKELFLNGNNLGSLEVIAEMYFPSLQNLNLKQNMILSLKSLRKCSIPNLKQLSLYKNKIVDPEVLSQLNSPALSKIWYNGTLQDGNLINSVSWVVKLQGKSIQKFIIKHNKRIQEGEVVKAIERKFGRKVKFQYDMQDDRLVNWV